MMIGNDIVDLQLAARESNWQRPGFLQKLFSSREIHDIQSAEDPNRMVWLYWSMKETAYKCISRMVSKRFYAPIQLICALESHSKGQVTGTVRYGKLQIHTISDVTEEYISTFTKHPDINTYHETLQMSLPEVANASQTLRHKITSFLSANMAIPTTGFAIIKDNLGIPSLRDLKKGNTFPISISHHGHFGSFTLPLSALD